MIANILSKLKLLLRMNGKHQTIPLVVVLGATGTGKSKLSIELAQKFGGEVISADSMQVYKGLDITTNKVTSEEQQLVKHHLLGIVDPLEKFHIHNFRNRALDIIETLRKTNKMPVIVGGTHYYIESILWNVLIEYKSSQTGEENMETISETDKEVESGKKARVYSKDMTDATSDLYEDLRRTDLSRALQLHPNDRRKIIESLKVYSETNRTYSDHLKAQKRTEGGNSLGGGLRFPNCVIFWIGTDQSVLDKRLDDRVSEMLQRGLLEELEDFHTRYNEMRLKQSHDRQEHEANRLESDVPVNEEKPYELGIFQSIGFKEFHDYLILPEDQKQTRKGQKLLEEGKIKMKQVTRRYAKRQLQWINNRFIRSAGRQVPPVYALDSSDPSRWEEKVLRPAVDVVQSFIDGEESGFSPVRGEPFPTEEIEGKFERNECLLCERTFIGRLQWEAHLKSNKHKKVRERKARQDKEQLEQEASSQG